MIVQSSVGFQKVSVYGTITKPRDTPQDTNIVVRSIGRCTVCEIDLGRFQKAKETIIVHSAYALLESVTKYDTN